MINAIRYTRVLEESGFSKEQASAALKVGLEIMTEKFATKQDIQISELALRSDMKEMEAGIRSDMKAMESSIRSDMKDGFAQVNKRFIQLDNKVEKMQDRLTIRLSSVMVVLMTVMVAVLKLT